MQPELLNSGYFWQGAATAGSPDGACSFRRREFRSGYEPAESEGFGVIQVGLNRSYDNTGIDCDQV